jgi:hypothetical protein
MAGKLSALPPKQKPDPAERRYDAIDHPQRAAPAYSAGAARSKLKGP